MKKGLLERFEKYQRIALMFQGGGALGAYQVGVYKALEQEGCVPTWICGVSIGSINGALIAGNPPGKRLERLEEFWSLVTSRPLGAFEPAENKMGKLATAISGMSTVMLGQPGFFQPNIVSPWLSMPGSQSAISYYDTSELRRTLRRLIDFDRLNSGEIRLSVGAVSVETGDNVFFDTNLERLTVDHIMASGALPPALPMVKIGDSSYWDGGIVDNTPLQYLLDQEERLSSLVFLVELFKAAGEIPRQMSEVETRQKDITYSSRTRQATHGFKKALELRRKLAHAYQRIAADQRSEEEKLFSEAYAEEGVVNLIELIYQSRRDESNTKDYEFSRSMMEFHMEVGYMDAQSMLAHLDWLDLPSIEQGVVIHRLHVDDLTKRQ